MFSGTIAQENFGENLIILSLNCCSSMVNEKCTCFVSPATCYHGCAQRIAVIAISSVRLSVHLTHSVNAVACVVAYAVYSYPRDKSNKDLSGILITTSTTETKCRWQDEIGKIGVGDIRPVYVSMSQIRHKLGRYGVTGCCHFQWPRLTYRVV